MSGCAAAQGGPASLPERHNPEGVARVLAVGSGKGGVGKSTVTALSAVALARRGLKVGIFDADLTGPSIPKLLGVTERPTGYGEGILPPVTSTLKISVLSMNLLLEDPSRPVIWRGPLIAQAIRQFWGETVWGSLDLLLVDLPPGTSDAPLTVFQTARLDGFLAVTTPQGLAGEVMEKSLHLARELDTPLAGVVENQSYALCPCCGKTFEPFGPGNLQSIQDRWGMDVGIRLPLDPDLAALGDRGKLEEYRNDQVLTPLEEGLRAIFPVI